jgi:hypothetical protein
MRDLILTLHLPHVAVGLLKASIKSGDLLEYHANNPAPFNPHRKRPHLLRDHEAQAMSTVLRPSRRFLTTDLSILFQKWMSGLTMKMMEERLLLR